MQNMLKATAKTSIPAISKLPLPHGGATTTGPDATHPPTIFQNLRGGGAVGGGSNRGSGGGECLPGVGGGVWPGVWGGGGVWHTRTGPGRPPVLCPTASCGMKHTPPHGGWKHARRGSADLRVQRHRLLHVHRLARLGRLSTEGDGGEAA